MHADALLGRGQLGGRALDELGTLGLRQVAERAQHRHQRAAAGDHRRGARGEALSLLEELGGNADPAGLAGDR